MKGEKKKGKIFHISLKYVKEKELTLLVINRVKVLLSDKEIDSLIYDLKEYKQMKKKHKVGWNP